MSCDIQTEVEALKSGISALNNDAIASNFIRLINQLRRNEVNWRLEDLNAVAIALIDISRSPAINGIEIKMLYLKAIKALFFNRPQIFLKYRIEFCGPDSILHGHLESNNETVKACTIMFISNMISYSGFHMDIRVEDWCFLACFRILCSNRYSQPTVDQAKTLCGAWEAVRVLIESFYQPAELDLNTWFTALRSAMSFTTPSMSLFDTVDELRRTFSSNDQVFCRPSNWNAKRRKTGSSPLQFENGEASTTENSQLIDADHSSEEETTCHLHKGQVGGVLSRRKADKVVKVNLSSENFLTIQVRIRLAALRIFGLSCRFLPRKLLMSRWFDFFPDSSAPPANSLVIDLLAMIIDEPDRRCRSFALSASRQWIDACTEMLAKAERSKKTLPFVSFSEKLALSVTNVHRSLILMLNREKYSSVIVEIIKTIKCLSNTVNYEKLGTTLFVETVVRCRTYLSSFDTRIRTAALSLYSTLLDCSLSDKFCQDDSLLTSLFTTSLFGLEKCIPALNDNTSESFVLETLTILKKLCRIRWQHISAFPDLMTRLNEVLIKIYSIERCATIISTGLQLTGELINHSEYQSVMTEQIVDALIKLLNDSKDIDVAITVEAVGLASKCISGKLVSESTIAFLKQPILSLCDLEQQQVELALLKSLPTMVSSYNKDLTYCSSAFEFTLRILTARSANTAEKAGDSLVHLTRTTLNSQWAVSVAECDVNELIFNCVCQALAIAADQRFVQRIKPACLSVAALFLDNSLRILSESCIIRSRLETVYSLTLPITIDHCRSNIIKVQKIALECASSLFATYSSLAEGSNLICPTDLLATIVECMRRPAIKIRNKLLAARSFCSISHCSWIQRFGNDLLLDATQSTIDSLFLINSDAKKTMADLDSKESAVVEVVRSFLHLIVYSDAERIRLIHDRLAEDPDVASIKQHFETFKMFIRREVVSAVLDTRRKIFLEQQNCSLRDYEQFKLFLRSFHDCDFLTLPIWRFLLED